MNFKKQFLVLFLLGTLLVPHISLAVKLNLEGQYPTLGGINISESDQALNQLIAWFYYFAIATSGFFAFFGLVVGGFRWLASAGNPSAIAEAKDQIIAAILGLVLILASYVLLNIVNPQLTTLSLPSL